MRLRCSDFSINIIIIIIIFGSLVAANAEALKGGPMLNCSGLPCVDITIPDGKHLRMLIDTGNVNSMLDAAVAKAIGLELTPVSGSDGKPIPGYRRSVLTEARLGDASLGDVKVLVADIASYVKKDQMPAADGTLSYTAFKNRLLQLDYKKQTVLVSELLTQNVPCPGFCGEITTPTFGRKGPPIVVSTGFMVNGQPLTVQLDTLFSGTMLVYPPSVEKLGLAKESESQKKQFFKYTDGGVNMMEAEAATESFGSEVLGRKVPVFFATDEVHQPDAMFDGTVGHGLFKGRILTLDFHSNHAWLM